MGRPDFPKSLKEFQARFRDDEACRTYLAACRWPEGFRCSRCEQAEVFALPRRRLWQCKTCGRQTSLTAGTVLHRTRLPLTVWFWATYLMTTHTPGLSAVQLQRQLGLSYETAWALLHKLRRAMVRPSREALKERGEGDENYVGGPEVGLKGGRQLLDKALIVGAVEVRGTAAGRVRLHVVPDASARSLTGFVKRTVAPGTLILTDAWQAYATLGDLGYRHRPRTQGAPARAAKLLPHILGSLATSRLGSPAPTTASATTTSRCTSTSSPSASTAGGPRWPPSRPSSVSPPASTARRPTTCCTVRSQPDRQNRV